MKIYLTEQEVENIKLVRDYFLKHDETTFEHFSYGILNGLVKKFDTICTCIAFHKTDECYKLGCKKDRLNKQD